MIIVNINETTPYRYVPAKDVKCPKEEQIAKPINGMNQIENESPNTTTKYIILSKSAKIPFDSLLPILSLVSL